jgi:hypothetical protein
MRVKAMRQLLAFALLFLPLVSLVFVVDAAAQNAWFFGQMPYGAGTYPVTVRISVDSVAEDGGPGISFTGISFIQEGEYRGADTAFYLRTDGAWQNHPPQALWQNSVRSGVKSLETSFRDYGQEPALIRVQQGGLSKSHTFENDAVPEEFLYLLALQMDSVNASKSLKVLPSVWESSYALGAWLADGAYTGEFSRIDGVDCYQVQFSRIDGPTAEYYISKGGHQVIAFKTFRGTWFKRVQ